MESITHKLCRVRELLNEVSTTIETDGEVRGFETDAETNCLHHVQAAIDAVCEVIERYAADYERQVR
jgi:hypothetical protein